MKSLIVIPTYNEKENIKDLIRKISDILPDIHILIIDDDSPDGTAVLVKELASEINNLHLIVRRDKRGRGLAGIAGFKYAVENKFDYVIEMDADFSHNPKYIPVFLREIETCDVVVGSRAVTAGGIIGRGFIRNIISKLANIYIRLILGIKNIKDATSGFRCFRRQVLDGISWDAIISHGPSIVEEVLYLAYRQGYKIKEIPIVFEERKQGKSKLNFKKIFLTMLLILKIRKRYA